MAPGAPPEQPHWHPRHNPWLIAVSVMIATFMEVLDTSVANVSLPHIAGTLSATTEESTWVLTSYLIANAIILPATNWLGQLFGRKRFLFACIALFTISSALCGAAFNLGFLVAARVLQGASGGALQPISQAVLLESFPPSKRGAAMAVFALGVVVAPIIGPTLGGWITDNYSWRWIFYINLPFGALALFMGNIFIEDPPYLQRVSIRSIDYIGFSVMAIWLAALQIVLDKGQEEDWFASPLILWCAIISAIAFVAFLRWECHTPEPLVDLSVLRNRNFSVGLLLMTILGAILYGTTAVLPLFMQTLLGYPALQAGIAMSPRGMGAFATTLIIGRLVGKISNRILIGTGFIILSIASFMLGNLNLEIGIGNVVFPSIINGIAISFIFVPLTTSTMGTLTQRQIGNATGIFNLMRNLGGGIGISGITTLLQRGAQEHQALLAAHTTLLNPAFREHYEKLTGALSVHGDPVAAANQAAAILYGVMQRQASLLAYVDNFRLFGVICLLCLPTLLLLKKVAPRGRPVAAH